MKNILNYYRTFRHGNQSGRISSLKELFQTEQNIFKKLWMLKTTATTAEVVKYPFAECKNIA